MLHLLAIQGEEIGAMAVIGGFSLAMLGMVMGTVRRNVEVREREQSRREIAAYVAEGSMSAEQGERLIAAGKRGRDRGVTA